MQKNIIELGNISYNLNNNNSLSTMKDYTDKVENVKDLIDNYLVFTIYTTGIADSTDGITKFSLMQSNWNDWFCNYVLSFIPDRFKKIKILHHDILMQFTSPTRSSTDPTEEEKIRITKFINERINNYDNKNPKVESKFIIDYLPIKDIEKKKSPYIILDFSNIFINMNDHGYVIESNHYNFKKKIDINNRYKLKSFYPEYASTELRDFLYKKSIPLFTVDSDDNVYTFIDHIIDKIGDPDKNKGVNKWGMIKL
jgi:hypothetical protein